MACDGNIDPRELEEIKALAANTTYFKGVDVTAELQKLVAEVKEEGRKIFKHYLDALEELDCDVVQELMILEVALRVICVDERVDPNEARLLRLLRSKLQVPDEILLARFGPTEILLGDKKVTEPLIEFDEDNLVRIEAGLSEEAFKAIEFKLDE
jgi:uncharacterized tellurite resistance protein B-like protein